MLIVKRRSHKYEFEKWRDEERRRELKELFWLVLVLVFWLIIMFIDNI